MWQHVQWSGVKGYAVNEAFKKIGITEMKHAEKIAERLFYLGGKPTTKPEAIIVGDNLKEMIEADIKAEDTAIILYKEIIQVAEGEGDVTTAHIFRKILEEEEEHQDTFTTLNEEV
jgi:bacterioferritin